MKKSLLIALITFCIAIANAQSLFQKYYGDTATEKAYCIQITSDGGTIIAGGTNSSGNGDYDVLLVKTTINGDTLWSKTYGGTKEDIAQYVIETNDNGFLLVGYTTSFGFGDYDGYIIKTDATGNLLWSKTYGNENMNYYLSAIKDISNGFVLVGSTYNADGYSDVFVTNIDSIGNIIWSKKYSTDDYYNNDEGVSINSYYDSYYKDWYYNIAGTTDSAGNIDILAFQIGTTGTIYWSNAYGGSDDDKANHITGIYDTWNEKNYFVISGSSSSFSDDLDAYTLVLNDAGDTINTRVWGNNSEDVGYCAALTQENNEIFITTVGKRSYGADDDIILNKSNLDLTYTNSVLWTLVYGGEGSDVAYSNAIYKNNIIIAGSTGSFGQGQDDAFIMKTNMQGYTDGINSKILWTPIIRTTTEITDISLIANTFGDMTTCTTISNSFAIKSKIIHENAQAFVKAIGGENDEQASDMEITNGGGLVFGGESYSFSYGDPYIIKTDNDLNIEWAKTIYMGSSWGTLKTIKQLSDNNYLFIGNNDKTETLIGKTDSVGNIIWSKSISKTYYTINGLDILPTSDNNYLFVSKYTDNGYDEGLVLVKTDTAGTIIWDKKIPYKNSYNDNDNYKINVASNGNFYVCSNVDFSKNEIGLFVMMFNNNGDTLWTKTFWNNSYLYATASCSTADNGLLLSSNSYEDNYPGDNISIIKINENGIIEWKKVFGNDGEIYIHDVSLTSDNGFIISAYNNYFPSMIKLDSVGSVDWSHSYFSNDLDAYLVTAKETSDKGFALLGYNSSFGNGEQDVLVTKTDKYGRSIYCVNKDFQLDTITDRTFEYSNTFNIEPLSVDITSLDIYSENITPSIQDYNCNTTTVADSKFQRALGNTQFYLTSNNFSETDDGGLMIAYTINDNKACVAKLKPDLKTLDWAKTYNQGSTYADDVIQTSNGIYFLADDESIGGSYLVKLNKQGDTLWTRSYNEEGWFYSIINTIDNNLVLVGKSLKDNIGGNGYSDLILLKIKPNGDIIWSKIIGEEYYDIGNSVKETSDGGFIIGGTSNSFSVDNYTDALIIKTDKFGTIEWSNTYGNDYAEACYSVIETADKGYIFTGYSNSFANDNQIYIVRLDHQGNKLWSEVFFNKASGKKIIQTTDGNYIIGATSSDDITLLKINDNGCMIWAKQYGGTELDTLTSLMQAPDGGYYVLGHTSSFASRDELYLIKTDKDGSTGDCHETSLSNIAIETVTTYTGNQTPIILDNNVFITSPEMKNKNKTTSFSARSVIMDISIDSTWVKCFGESNGSVKLTINGGVTPFAYEWSNEETTESLSNVLADTYTVTVTDKHECIVVKSIQVPEPPALTIDSIIDNISCNNMQDGYIEITASGGIAPYRYTWNTGSVSDFLWGLSPNKYTVTVFDNKGCFLSSQFNITQPSPISLKFTNTNITCGKSNGAILVDAKGGTGILTYDWSNNKTGSTLSSIKEGTYTVTVTDENECEKIDSVLINIDTYPPSLCVVTVGDSTNNNIIVWERIKGAAIKEYKVYKKNQWNNNFEVIGTVQQSDTTQFTDLHSNSLVHSDWYALTIIDSCDNESEMSLPHKTMHLNTVKGLNNTVNLIWESYEGLDFDAYIIMRGVAKDKLLPIDTVNYAITSWTDIDSTKANQLYYNIAIALKNTCRTFDKATEKGPYTMSRSNVEDAGVIDNGSGIAELDGVNGLIEVFPNPVSDELIIHTASTSNELQITNALGQVVLDKEFSSQNTAVSINTKTLANGMYYVRIGNAVKKFVVNK